MIIHLLFSCLRAHIANPAQIPTHPRKLNQYWQPLGAPVDVPWTALIPISPARLGLLLHETYLYPARCLEKSNLPNSWTIDGWKTTLSFWNGPLFRWHSFILEGVHLEGRYVISGLYPGWWHLYFTQVDGKPPTVIAKWICKAKVVAHPVYHNSFVFVFQINSWWCGETFQCGDILYLARVFQHLIILNTDGSLSSHASTGKQPPFITFNCFFHLSKAWIFFQNMAAIEIHFSQVILNGEQIWPCKW